MNQSRAVMLGGLGLTLLILPLLARLDRWAESPGDRALVGGLAFAAIILVSYVVAYAVLEGRG